MSVYLADGTHSVSQGGLGSGLTYANTGGGTACGVAGGFVGVALDAYGDFGIDASANVGGLSESRPSSIGVRGSGTPCTKSYPWVDGAAVPGLVTATTGDPATAPASTYRRVRLSVQPQGETLQLTVSMTGASVSNQPAGAFEQIMATNLASVAGQADLPPTLKLGFGASTGGASNYMDIRRVNVRAFTDTALTHVLSGSTPGHLGYPSGTFLPGDAVSFDLTASNRGPSVIGDAPEGVAVIYDDLSSLPLSNVSWTCTASDGGICATGGGTGSVVSEDWAGPPGAKVTVTVNAVISTTVSSGTYTSDAEIPTDFTSMTVDTNESKVQRDGGLADTDLTNNSASVPFMVALVADAGMSTVSAAPTHIVANGASTSTVTVTVTVHDEHGNRLTAGGNAVMMNTVDGILSNVADNGDGSYTATLTAPSLVGQATIGFTVDGVVAPTTTIVVFDPGPAAASSSSIEADSTEILADGVSTSRVTVMLRDVNGNLVREGATWWR